MERFFISMVAGIVIPQSLVLALWAGAGLGPEWDRYLEMIARLISWPELLLPRAAFNNISGVILVMIFGNFITYSLLTYIVTGLWKRGSNLKLP